MLLRKKVVEKSKKSIFFSFFVPPFLLDCVFWLTKLKRRNDENVLFWGVLAKGAEEGVKRMLMRGVKRSKENQKRGCAVVLILFLSWF